MSITRREWLELTGFAGLALALPNVTACSDDGPSLPSYEYDGVPGPATMFESGVASGDPLADAVVLWTRTAAGLATGSVEVWLDVATDPAFRRRIVAQTFTTDETTDYTLKVDLDGLEPGTTYYYRFFALGIQSPVGRTRTAPSGAVANVKFGLASCSNFGFGLFHSYRHLAARDDLDAIIHLGDYIYEYQDGYYPLGSQRQRNTLPATEITSLDEYRERYRHYRTDPDLREAHRQHPWFVIWDDHEIADNAYDTGAVNHQPAFDGDYAQRLADAKQAFYEYIPIRGLPAAGIEHRVTYGDLVDLILLDTRTKRSQQIADATTDTTDRTMLGATQEAWLTTQLMQSTAKWRLIAQQIVVAQYTDDAVAHTAIFTDQWDGYPFARTRLFDAIETHGGGNVVVLTGDLHGACVFDLVRDPWASTYDPVAGTGALAVEFVVTSVTAPYLAVGTITTEETDLAAACPHLAYTNLRSRGFTVLDVTHGAVQADYYVLDSVTAGSAGVATFEAGYRVVDGVAHAIAATGAVPAGAGPAPAP